MKKAVSIIILVFFFFIIQNLTQSIFSLWQKRELLISARIDVERTKKENQSLKEQMSAVKKPSFIEKQARDKLYLTKPGEQIVIIPDNLIVEEKADQNVKNSDKTNWQMWWDLFF